MKCDNGKKNKNYMPLKTKEKPTQKVPEEFDLQHVASRWRKRELCNTITGNDWL